MSSNTTTTAPTTSKRSVLALPVDEGIVCLRGLSPRRLRFEVEYGLERGTTANSFLFETGARPDGRLMPPVIVHPPGASFEAPFLAELRQRVPTTTALKVVVGHVNPNRVALLRKLANDWPQLMLVASNPGCRLLQELWDRPSSPGQEESERLPLPPLPPIDVVKKDASCDLPSGKRLTLLPVPTPRWPGGLVAFEESTGLLMSDKFFATHVVAERFEENSPGLFEEDRRYFYDCLMAPMARQVESVVERLEQLNLRTIAPGHGPAISEGWRSLIADYHRWGESHERSELSVALLFASAYGNTAAIADALAQGVSRAGVRVESINCEFSPGEQLLNAIRKADALLIGSPTLGGHAPTPIVAALGTVLVEGDRSKPVGVFGSFGWGGEAIDLLESKLRDGGFCFAFDPIRVQFSPDVPAIKAIEESGTALARQLRTEQRRQQRRGSEGLQEVSSDPAMQALGRIVGSLSVLTARRGSDAQQLSGAMVASWVSQASFTPPGFTVAVAKERAVEALLHVGDQFALNLLAAGRESATMRRFLKPFPPGADRFAGLELEATPNGQPVLPEALAWLEATVLQRMECGDHWLIYAQASEGTVLDAEGTTAVHQRRSGANY